MDVHHRHREKFLRRVTEHLANGRIGFDEAFRLDVGNQQPIDHAFINRAEFLEAPPQRLLDLLEFCDVLGEPEASDDVAVAVAQLFEVTAENAILPDLLEINGLALQRTTVSRQGRKGFVVRLKVVEQGLSDDLAGVQAKGCQPRTERRCKPQIGVGGPDDVRYPVGHQLEERGNLKRIGDPWMLGHVTPNAA